MLTAKAFARAPYLAILVALSLGTGLAQAHAKLLSADPAPNATVATQKMIQLHFSEEIAKKFSSVRLTTTDGIEVALMTMDAKDAKSLSVMPNTALAAGQYTVSWVAVASDDGHKTTGTFSFRVK